MSLIQLIHTYDDIISLDNLLEAWSELIVGKKKRKDIQVFKLYLMDNIFNLHTDLKNKTYMHGGYEAFNISDPKPRSIHKATVRDRLVHHAIYRSLYTFFDRTFISDSYSCRLSKGTHKAINRFRSFSYIVSKNHTKTVFVLKCDIRKFFASVNHKILTEIIESYIPDKDITLLIKKIIDSFYSTKEGVGLPLGNLTSQLLVNIYMNKFDQIVKHKLKIKYYIRYADDFVIFSQNKEYLEKQILEIKDFLCNTLKLTLHPDKISIKTIASGVDYLGWVNFPDHRVLRTVTRRRMFKNIKNNKKSKGIINSYLGLLGHGNSRKLEKKVRNLFL
jgi:retron-type reverse transcriptase